MLIKTTSLSLFNFISNHLPNNSYSLVEITGWCKCRLMYLVGLMWKKWTSIVNYVGSWKVWRQTSKSHVSQWHLEIVNRFNVPGLSVCDKAWDVENEVRKWYEVWCWGLLSSQIQLLRILDSSKGQHQEWTLPAVFGVIWQFLFILFSATSHLTIWWYQTSYSQIQEYLPQLNMSSKR